VTPYGTQSYTTDYSAQDKPIVENYNKLISANNTQIQQFQQQSAAAQAVLTNPQSTPQQKAQAQNAINQAKAQIEPLQKQNDTYHSSMGQYTPIYTQNTTLSPDQQQILNYQTQGQKNLGAIGTGMQGQVANSYTNPIDISNLFGVAGKVQQDGGTTASAIKSAQDAAYKGQTQYLDPRYTKQQTLLENQLANQGLDRNSEAYKNAMQDFNLQKSFDYQQAQNAAVGAGMTAQNQYFNQGLSDANLQNAANTQQLQQLFAVRNQPLNEYNALMNGAQLQNPQFSNVPVAGVQGTDIGGYINNAYQGQMNQYNSKVGAQNSMNQGIGQLAGTAASMYAVMSFSAWKEDKQPVDDTDILDAFDALTVERWKYKPEFVADNGEHIGVYAEDFQKAFNIGDGHTINMIDALGVCMSAIKALKFEIATLKENAYV